MGKSENSVEKKLEQSFEILNIEEANSSYRDKISYEKFMGFNTGFIGKSSVPDEDIDDSKFSEILRGIVSEKDFIENESAKNIFLKKHANISTVSKDDGFNEWRDLLKKVNQKMPSIRCKKTIDVINMMHGGCYADAFLSEKKYIDSNGGTESIH